MALRVSGGSARGLPLIAPRGKQVRPTSERTRNALFSIIGGLGLEGSRVADLFAGTGALGIEALSRGAAWADFVEQSPAQCRAIRESLKAARLEEQARVWRMSAARALDALAGPYQFIFADPPYAQPGIEELMERLAAGALLSPTGVLVLEHAARRPAPAGFGPLRLWQSRKYGDACLSLYRGGDAW